MRGKFAKAAAILLLTIFLVPGPAAGGDGAIKAGRAEAAGGTLESLENVATAWMYGTHALKGEEGEILYALESEPISLDDFEGEAVSVRGVLVHKGLEGGPPLLDVNRVSVVPGGEVPTPPNAFYGRATIDGENLPENSLIIARVSGAVRVVVAAEDGRYGVGDPIQVQGEAGDKIEFYTVHEGAEIKADQTPTFEMGEIQRLDLTFPRPTEFEVSDLSVTKGEVEPGEATRVSVEVTNTGGTEGTHRVELSINGEVVDNGSVSLAPGESGTISFTVSEAEEGTYEVSLEDLTGSFVVRERGFGFPWTMVAVAVVAVAIGIVVIWRWRSRPLSSGGLPGGKIRQFPCIFLFLFTR